MTPAPDQLAKLPKWARRYIADLEEQLASVNRGLAFAEAILAANEAWLDSQTPTLEELRAKYPAWDFGMFKDAEEFCAVLGRETGPWLPTEKSALRWLAARLEELNSSKSSNSSDEELEAKR